MKKNQTSFNVACLKGLIYDRRLYVGIPTLIRCTCQRCGLVAKFGTNVKAVFFLNAHAAHGAMTFELLKREGGEPISVWGSF